MNRGWGSSEITKLPKEEVAVMSAEAASAHLLLWWWCFSPVLAGHLEALSSSLAPGTDRPTLSPFAMSLSPAFHHVGEEG